MNDLTMSGGLVLGRVLRSAIMRAQTAIDRLRLLRDEGSPQVLLDDLTARESWKGRVRATLVRSLGDHDLVKKFDSVKDFGGIGDRRPPSILFGAAMSQRLGYIDVAIYDLEGLTADDDPVDERAFDPALWEHVKQQVADEDWGKLASQTAIFVEDRIRKWTGDPKDRNGDSLVGKGLFTQAFSDESEFRLGSRKGEWEGWRALGVGFAQALSNVDRHHIKERPDARKYALGVLGLGSLLLTQLRHDHGDILSEEQA